jgi:hypothetical protein
MDFILNVLSSYFKSSSFVQSALQIILFVVAVYGIFRVLLFILRYYIIYNVINKLLQLIKLKKANPTKLYTKPEDERLRDEKKEREVEKVELERMGREEEQEQEFKIYIPKAIGKWQKFVLGSRQNVIVAVAKEMQKSKNTNFWQAYVKSQRSVNESFRDKEYERSKGREL